MCDLQKKCWALGKEQRYLQNRAHNITFLIELQGSGGKRGRLIIRVSDNKLGRVKMADNLFFYLFGLLISLIKYI